MSRKEAEPCIKVFLKLFSGRAAQRDRNRFQIFGESIKAGLDTEKIQFILILKIMIYDPFGNSFFCPDGIQGCAVVPLAGKLLQSSLQNVLP